MKNKSIVYLSIGTNVGDRLGNLANAIKCISNIDKVEIKENSNIYCTKPYGYLEQDEFLNIVTRISTQIGVNELLDKFQIIEKNMGREKNIYWGPRIIDIDILLYDDTYVNDENLIVPHKDMYNRAFVLIPLREIYNNDCISIEFDRLIDNCVDKDGVKFFRGSDFFERK